MLNSDLVSFIIGYVASLLIAASLYTYNIWDTLYPSLVTIDYGWVIITLFGCLIPAMFGVLINNITKDL